MGQRGELFSTRVNKDDVTYFFNVKENIYGERFLNIAQSTKEGGRFSRQSIVVYMEKLDFFMQNLEKQISLVKEKAPTGKPLEFKPLGYGTSKKEKKPRFPREEPLVLGRVYQFETSTDDWGDYSISITEKRSNEEGTYNLRQSVKVYQEDLGEFVRKLQEAVDYLRLHQKPQAVPQTVKVKRHLIVKRKESEE